MHKLLKVILFILFNYATISVNAQNKFAVLIAVNDYYQKPHIKHPSSLHGCVNDAKSIRALLINRFGFEAAKIQSLYDSSVTKPNVTFVMKAVLNKCKPGDAVVFYYSGHGVYIKNALNNDKIKNGYSQAIVMSDLYSVDYNCLFTDEMLKGMFDEFVRKGIILTTLFDCCYSGNLPMTTQGKHYWSCSPEGEKKSLDIAEIPHFYYRPVKAKPKGCTFNIRGSLTDSLDTDHDGVPDCKDWEINTPLYSLVDSFGIREADMLPQQVMSLPADYDSMALVNGHNDLTSTTRSYKLKDNIKLQYKPSNARPSEIANSHFLSLSATTDLDPAEEITDESGLKHGLFTKALLTVYQQNKADITVPAILNSLSLIMRHQEFNQRVIPHIESGRYQGNLIGIAPTNFHNTLKALCLAETSGTIDIDKGVDDGITRGNILTDKSGNKIQVKTVFHTHATAVGNPHALINKGDIFTIVDNYAMSNPLVRIYVQSVSFTPAAFNDFFRNTILPQARLSSFGDYNYFSNVSGSGITSYNDDLQKEKSYVEVIYSPQDGSNTDEMNYVFLPIPSYIAESCKKLLSKDQNIEVVGDKNKADYILFLNCTKDRPGHKQSFVFYFHPPFSKQQNSIFSEENYSTTSLTLQPGIISQQIANLAKKTFRCQNNARWINIYPRR